MWLLRARRPGQAPAGTATWRAGLRTGDTPYHLIAAFSINP